MKKLLFLCTALLVCSLGTASANADAIVQGFTGGVGPFGSFFGVGDLGDVVGFRFTADETGTFTALGVMNALDVNVLNGAHMVGVWRNSDMALLGSVTVDPSTAFFQDDWWYANVAPIAITAGEEYTLGAGYSTTDGDSYWSGPSTIDLMHISSTNGVSPDDANLGFIYPGTDSTNLARLGPNALFRTVPEPASFGMFAVVGLGMMIRRRK